MIERRASEIISMAETMSQIQNTDALSWRDKIDILNQSYVRLYTDLNNSGDLYYSKEYIPDLSDPNIKNNRLPLPKDFWKLLFVGYKSMRGDFIPVERAPNGSTFYSGYRIQNNEIIFNNLMFPGPLCIRYIPRPQTITFPNKPVKIDGKWTSGFFDSIEQKIILGKTGEIAVYDIPSGNLTSFPMMDESDPENPVPIAYTMCIEDESIFVITSTELRVYDYDFNLFDTIAAASISAETVFSLYVHAIGWEYGVIFTDEAGIVYRYNDTGSIESGVVDHWNYLSGNINKTGDNFVYVDETEETIDLTEVFAGADSYVITNPYIYINKGGSVTIYDETFTPMDIAPSTIGYGARKGKVLGGEVNHTSGYGIVFNDAYSGLNLLGYAPDTVLNYPQNIFFDWLATDLAVKFRMALDIPTNELPALADDYYNTLIRSLSRDSFKAQRINNVYSSGIYL